MSDVKDILGLTHKGGQPTPKATTKKQTAKNNPLTKGLAREVRNLLDDNNRVPGLVQAQTQFKAKRSRKISWKLERIRSSARRTITGKEKDDLDIFHWVKIHNMPDYRFAKWNKELKMLKYTDVEYENHLKDPKWSRAETDKLFDLCRRFDLRFLVIHDRYNPILNNLEVPYIPKSTHEGYPFAAAAATTGGGGGVSAARMTPPSSLPSSLPSSSSSLSLSSAAASSSSSSSAAVMVAPAAASSSSSSSNSGRTITDRLFSERLC
mmetsp:Transcript_44253/g.73788  ORF Transcript_44253/g.73788 Transcript_44253/m.73788 type:complete len:265 (+) Transcript_44253:470-1264(+)